MNRGGRRRGRLPLPARGNDAEAVNAQTITIVVVVPQSTIACNGAA
jgi:hypothetical protein